MNRFAETTGHMPTGTGDSSPQSLVQTFANLNSPSSSSSASRNNGDSTFEPTIDMMVNDFDDEQTLEEEEALAATEASDPAAELTNLQRESDMPIEELLALYNCALPANTMNRIDAGASAGNSSRVKRTPTNSNASEKSNDQQEDNEEEADFEESEEEEEEEEDEEDADSKEQSQLHKLYPETYGGRGNKRLLRTISRQSDDDGDGEYSADERELKKTIMVGSEFQAVIPEGLKKYDDVLPYENEDKLLWDPRRLSEKQTEEYLFKIRQSKKQSSTGIDTIPVGSHLRDDEQALHLLLQCGYNIDEALRRKRINAVPATEKMSIWSEEECRNFESGIRVHGKDFYTIKHTKVKTRSVGELVQFYYLWKKTERHDVFANKARLEKKKYSLHPGLTDYMDRFIDEQDSNGNGSTNQAVRDRSSSPNAGTYLQQNEAKRKNSTASTSGNQNKVGPIPPDPLAVGDAEVFSGINKNYMHKNSNKINLYNTPSTTAKSE